MEALPSASAESPILHPSRKSFDAANARGLLFDVSRILDESGVPHGLIFGTLLGAVRSETFMSWDSDVDIFLLDPDEASLQAALRKMKACDLVLMREFGWIVSFIRGTEYIDICIFRRRWMNAICNHIVIPLPLLDFKGSAMIDGRLFHAPKRKERLLRFLYGPDWRIPRPDRKATPYGLAHRLFPDLFPPEKQPRSVMRIVNPLLLRYAPEVILDVLRKIKKCWPARYDAGA